VSAPEILVVGCADTLGWRTIEAEFVASLARLDVPHRLVRGTPRLMRRLPRTYAMAELAEARAARRALRQALGGGRPRAVVLMSSTASLLVPLERLQRRGIAVAIRLDCPAAINRPGVAGLPQRALERRRLPRADAVIAMGPRSAATVAGLSERTIALPTTIDLEAAATKLDAPPRLLAYGANPERKGLDRILRAWSRLGRDRGDALLTVTGIAPDRVARALRRAGLDPPAGVEFPGPLPRDRHIEMLRGAAGFVSASRWEEWGIAQLEALAAGVPLVTTPARGAYEAEPLARELAPELVVPADDAPALARAMAAALALDPQRRARYRSEAARLLRPFGPAAVDRVMVEQVLPALLASDANADRRVGA
jgi:glycosyltransferase involved in cell wall biosynthesis